MKLTTAQILGRFQSELEREGVDYNTIEILLVKAADALLESIGLTVSTEESSQ